ncbi:hypothetical protein BGY98DRAFT_1061126 [Russula aff. rugulosa BPL654]|nr:hypothetical protein BGY98DRAFT_1061126 [Russula aff. rugulosa BPL654]
MNPFECSPEALLRVRLRGVSTVLVPGATFVLEAHPRNSHFKAHKLLHPICYRKCADMADTARVF